jgi:AcrR family transcriptional regulator
MSKADRTKATIAKVFRSLLEAKPAASISVQNIVDAAGINRKTFYYYFSNKEELVVWIFRQDIAQLLRERYPEDQLIDSTNVKNPADNFEALPYYVQIKVGVRALEQGSFLKLLADYFKEQRGYYRKIFASQLDLQTYMIHLYQNEFLNDINYILSGRYLSDEVKQFLAYYFAQATIHLIIDSIMFNRDNSSRLLFIKDIEPFLNITHESLKNIIETHLAEHVTEIRTKRRFREIF